MQAVVLHNLASLGWLNNARCPTVFCDQVTKVWKVSNLDSHAKGSVRCYLRRARGGKLGGQFVSLWVYLDKHLGVVLIRDVDAIVKVVNARYLELGLLDDQRAQAIVRACEHAVLGEVDHEAVEDLAPDLRVGHLPAAKTQRDLRLVAIGQEAQEPCDIALSGHHARRQGTVQHIQIHR